MLKIKVRPVAVGLMLLGLSSVCMASMQLTYFYGSNMRNRIPQPGGCTDWQIVKTRTCVAWGPQSPMYRSARTCLRWRTNAERRCILGGPHR